MTVAFAMEVSTEFGIAATDVAWTAWLAGKGVVVAEAGIGATVVTVALTIAVETVTPAPDCLGEHEVSICELQGITNFDSTRCRMQLRPVHRIAASKMRPSSRGYHQGNRHLNSNM